MKDFNYSSLMQNKVVVITGASSGIGAALADLVASRGASVALVARREEALRQVAARCGERALPIVADVTERAQIRRVVDETVRRFGRIDVWVNNAGRGITRPPSELTDEDVDEMMRVNVKSVAVRDAGSPARLQGARRRTRDQRVIDARSCAVRDVPVCLQRLETLRQRADRDVSRRDPPDAPGHSDLARSHPE